MSNITGVVCFSDSFPFLEGIGTINQRVSRNFGEELQNRGDKFAYLAKFDIDAYKQPAFQKERCDKQ